MLCFLLLGRAAVELGRVSVEKAGARPMSQDLAQLAKGAGITLVGRLAGRGITLVGQVVFARLLGPTVFGLYALGWTVLRMVGQIAPLGLDKGVIRFGSDYWASGDSRFHSVITASLVVVSVLGLAAGAAVYAAAPWLSNQLFHEPGLVEVLRWFAWALPLLMGLTVAAAATRVSRRMQYSAYSEDIAQPTVSLLLFIPCYWLGWRLVGALFASTVSLLAAFALAIIYLRRLFPGIFSPYQRAAISLRELMAFSLPASLAGSFIMFVSWVDRLIIGVFYPSAQVGVFQAVAQLAALFAVISSAFGTTFAPMIADLHARGQTTRLQHIFVASTKWGLYLSLPLFLVVCLYAREIVDVVYGAEYRVGWSALVILTVGQLANVGTGAVGNLLVMTANQNHWFLVTGAALAANIGLNWLLVPSLGATGAAISTASCLAALYLSGLILVRRILGIWPYDRRYLKGILAAVVAVVLAMLARLVPVDSSALALLLGVAAAGSGFVVTLLVLGLDSEDVDFIQLVRARLLRAG